MTALIAAGSGPAAINLNQPGSYLHWSIFTVSVANLVLIAVMVVIFGAALLLPFPRGRAGQPGGVPAEPYATSAGGAPERGMWTARLRRGALNVLPPQKLLPDRQPAYVASWVYVFGVASLAALGVAIASGFAIALGGVDWWHTNPVGHFLNSLHLWSVELFMALLVIHLWGKFWMAAWRGRRKVTWITGVIAFLASIVEAFTGYLSQQNFDSQWIATNGKDAFNAAGIGAFFNVMNTGQMLLWHVVLIPVVLVAIVGAHVLLVRVRGVVRPIDETGPAATTGRDGAQAATPSRGQRRRARAAADAAPWTGPTRRYDIVKEGVIASVVILALTFVMAGVLSSPDVPPVTVRSWAKVAPAGFLATAATELNGTSLSAGYGPPYNTNGSGQKILISWANAAGVHYPIDSANTFVLAPLSTFAPSSPQLASALASYRSAAPKQEQAWATAYAKAVTKARFVNGVPALPSAADGPVPVMLANELAMARSGALDADLLAQRQFYGTDFTKPLLFLEDGSYYGAQATAMHLTGTQWGVMNETGSYPGQPWLWLYQLWYQVPGFSTSPNVDLIAIYLTGIATLGLLAIPFVPGLRDIPRWIPVHRLIWRSWYRSEHLAGGTAVPAVPPRPRAPAEPSGRGGSSAPPDRTPGRT